MLLREFQKPPRNAVDRAAAKIVPSNYASGMTTLQSVQRVGSDILVRMCPIDEEEIRAAEPKGYSGLRRTASWEYPESSLNIAGSKGSRTTLPTAADRMRRTARFRIAWALPARLLGFDAATP
jgi:hypothetical protein